MDAKRGRLLGAVVLLIVGVVLALYSLATAQQAGAPAFVPGEVLVKLKTGVGAQVLATLKAQHGLESIRVFQRVGLHHFRILSKLSVSQVIARLRQSSFVEYAEPNYIRQLFRTPNDLMYPEMWGLNNTGQTGGTPGADIDAPQAWENVSRAVVDPLLAYPGEPGIPRTWDLSYAVAQAYPGGGPLRLVLYSADYYMHSGKYFHSSDVDDWMAEARPKLEVTWGNP